MKDKIITGIDIGSSKIATLVALSQDNLNELKIIGFNSVDSKGVKKGLIIDIVEVIKAVEESIEKAERMSGYRIEDVFVSVGGPNISSLNSHGIVAISNPKGEIEESDVDRVIEAARAISLSSSRKIIEVSPRDFIVDGQEGIKNPIGMTGVRLETDAHIITASSINLKNIERVLNDLGLINKGFVFSGLASAQSVLTDTEKELGVVVADIGGGKTDVTIFVDGSLSYSSSIPIGAKHITNDIAVGLRVSLDSAEKIKIHLSKESNFKKKSSKIDISGLNIPEELNELSLSNVVDNIIFSRLEEIYKIIFEEIEKSGFSQSIPAGLVITGGGALTIGMAEVGRKILGMPIRIGVPGKISGLIDEIIEPQYSTCVGLLLYGQKNSKKEKNDFKNFSFSLKDFDVSNLWGKLKNFFKQFIP